MSKYLSDEESKYISERTERIFGLMALLAKTNPELTEDQRCDKAWDTEEELTEKILRAEGKL